MARAMQDGWSAGITRKDGTPVSDAEEAKTAIVAVGWWYDGAEEPEAIDEENGIWMVSVPRTVLADLARDNEAHAGTAEDRADGWDIDIDAGDVFVDTTRNPAA